MTIDSFREDELDLVGTELDGRYRIDKFLGAGTMGSVYKATQLAVGRNVAIKILNQTFKTHHEVRERFRVEAQAIASLNHPNCITLFDFGYSDRLGALYMVVEYLAGHTLEERLSMDVPADEALSIGFQIADVLAQAHEAGILHRDLKPENVMLVSGSGQTPNVKVLDFGLARIFEDSSGGTRLTRQGQLFGTPAYMSPEQCGGSMNVGPAADIYALGITLYEMLQGRLPFVSDNVAEILVMHAKEEPPPLVSDDAPEEIVELVMSMLSKDPGARPTAPEVADALREFSTLSGRLPARAQKASQPVEARAPRARKKPGQTAELEAKVTNSDVFETNFEVPRRRTALPWALAAVAIVAVSAGFALFASTESSDATTDPAATLGHKAVFAPSKKTEETAEHASAAETLAESAAATLRDRAGELAAMKPEPAEPDTSASTEAAQPEEREPPKREKAKSRSKPQKTGESSNKPQQEAPKVRKLKFRY